MITIIRRSLMLLILLATLGVPSLVESSVFRHDIHISFGRAELHDNLFEAKLTIYKDDFLKALNNWHKGGYAGMDLASFRALELRYVTSFFRVWSARDVQLELHQSIRSEEDASVTFDLIYSLAKPATSLMLDDQILFREYGDQTNVLVLRAFGKEVNHVFTKSSTTYYVDHNAE